MPAVPRTFTPSEVQNQEREAIVRSSDVRLDAIAGEGRDALKRRAEYVGHEESIGNRPVKEAPRLNAVAGEVEQSYLLPNGGVSNNEALAELDAYKYRRRVDNMTIAGQMRSEQERLKELTRKRRELKAKLSDSPEKAEGLFTGLFYNKAQSDYYKVDGNQDIRSLDLAIRQSEERLGKLKRLSEEAGGKDVGFWRGLDGIVTDLRTWDMGIVDSRDAGARLAINKKRIRSGAFGGRGDGYGELGGESEYR